MSHLSLDASTSAYSTITQVVERLEWMTWEEWSDATLSKVFTTITIEAISVDGKKLYCTLYKEVELVSIAKPKLVRAGFVYALGITCALPLGLAPAAGVALCALLGTLANEMVKPYIDPEQYSRLLEIEYLRQQDRID